MKIHEYQAKGVLASFGVAIPRGELATTPEEARAAAGRVGGQVWVVKAQVHAGGRGKGGGIKVCKSLDEVTEKALAMIGSKLVTPQTGPEGRLVRKVYVEQGLAIRRELYLGLVLDRETRRIVLMASSEGGMEIEEVARTHPEKILKEYIDFTVGILPFQMRDVCFGLGLTGDTAKKAHQFMSGLYRAFVERDASLVEINPLVITADGDVLALDAKMNFDDNALSRHPEIQALRDLDEESPLEVEASKFNLNYIKLDGNVGCMVNGAGLAMSTMDIIKLAGGEPANFLDVGGGASAEQIENAFRILISDRNVRAVFINIFGGILRCDRLAEGVIKAVKTLGVRLPIVIRMEGTNVELGQRMLRQSGLNFITAQGMKDGAEKAVRAARSA